MKKKLRGFWTLNDNIAVVNCDKSTFTFSTDLKKVEMIEDVTLKKVANIMDTPLRNVRYIEKKFLDMQERAYKENFDYVDNAYKYRVIIGENDQVVHVSKQETQTTTEPWNHGFPITHWEGERIGDIINTLSKGDILLIIEKDRDCEETVSIVVE